jgi:phosphocarrier protein HPr
MTNDDAAGMVLRASAIIQNERGLHARASAKFVKLAASFDADIEVTRDDSTVNGTSIMGLMALGAGQGAEIEIAARGNQAEEALNAILALIARNFDEE